MKISFNLILISLFAGIAFNCNAQSTPFVPKSFEIPPVLETEQFRIRMLTVNDVVKDYDAVMSSIDHLKATFPGSSWPSKELTLEQDLIDLGWHQKEFQKRSSFAYTVMNPDETQCLGCVYINPCARPEFDAVVYLWVRASAFEDGLDPLLFDCIQKWIENDWPFSNVAYPGREIPWDIWEEESNSEVAKKFIDAFYSFNSELLNELLYDAEDSRAGILYYQKWAECGNYEIIERTEFIEVNDSIIKCPVKVKDDLIGALNIDFFVTDTFQLIISQGIIKAVTNSSNDPELYYEAQEWVKNNRPELIKIPCEGIWEDGLTPCDCVKAMVEGFKEFMRIRNI